MGHGMRIVEDVVCYANVADGDGVVAMLDFERAFDSIEWDFIFGVLVEYSLGGDYVGWIRALCFSPRVTVGSGGWLVGCIQVSRSVGQGCPVSALLFILCVEMLSGKVEVDAGMGGIGLNSLLRAEGVVECRTVQYAGDVC